MRLIKDPTQASDRPAFEHEPFGWIDEAEAYGESYHDTEEDLPSSEEGKEQAWPLEGRACSHQDFYSSSLRS